MKKVLRAVVVGLILCMILLLCFGCTDLKELQKQKEKEVKKEAARKGFYDTVLIPADK